MDADVIIVGGGPTGLMLAGELGLAGVRPLVLERRPRLRENARATGLGGQALDLLRHRGLPERVPRLGHLLQARAGGLGAEIRHGHELVGADQDDAAVTVEVRGPKGVHRLRARYLVGCDGTGSRVRASAGIAFTGAAYSEHGDDASPARFRDRQAERYRDGRILLAGDAAHQFPEEGAALGVGLLDAVNLAWKLAARVHGWAPPGLLDTYHGERHPAGARALRHARARVALRRGNDPAAEALREVFGELPGDVDARYPLPGSDRHALIGTFIPDLPLYTDRGVIGVANLMRAARPVLLDLADRQDLREFADAWRDRIDRFPAKTDDPPADALLIRPDGHVVWAAAVDEPFHRAMPTLHEALFTWFGAP